MDVLNDRCCGIDVHKDILTACIMITEGKKVKTEIKEFSTMTFFLLQLVDWLKANNITQVAMESTGVYWKPVYNILEAYGDFEVILANARNVKNVPGRKTDKNDSKWLARLLRSGLIESSYIPPIDIRELRDLVRYRTKLVCQVTAEKNRVDKVLQDANIKLSSVASDIFGVSCQDIIQMLINGEEITEESLNVVVKGKLRKKIPLLVEAVNGHLTEHHIFLLKKSLNHIDYLTKEVEDIELEIGSHMEAYQEETALLETIPGVKNLTIANIIAELGSDMSVFPTQAHVSSWAHLSPGSNESAGKKKSGKTQQGSPHIKTALCEAAWGAVKTKKTYFRSKYWRLASRRGKKKAIIAIAHKLLIVIYNMLKNKEAYRELGEDYLDNLRKDKNKDKLIKRLEAMGFSVDLKTA